MYRIVLAPVALALALSACNKGPEVSMTNASAEDVAKAAKAAGPKLKGGQWEVKSELVSAEIPGAPASVVESMKKSGSTTVSQCFTDEQLNSQNGAMGKMGENCKFADFKMGNGSMSGTATCKMPQGEATSKVSGTYADDKFDYAVESSASMPNNQTTKMNMKISGKRTGDCTAPKTN